MHILTKFQVLALVVVNCITPLPGMGCSETSPEEGERVLNCFAANTTRFSTNLTKKEVSPTRRALTLHRQSPEVLLHTALMLPSAEQLQGKQPAVEKCVKVSAHSVQRVPFTPALHLKNQENNNEG